MKCFWMAIDLSDDDFRSLLLIAPATADRVALPPLISAFVLNFP